MTGVIAAVLLVGPGAIGPLHVPPARCLLAGRASLLHSGFAWAQEPSGSTAAMREKVYEKLSWAQRAAESKKYSDALEALQVVEKMKDLDAYEKAQLYTAFGYVYFLQEMYNESIGAYEKVLQQEQLPQALQATTLYTIAQLQLHAEHYADAISYLERWLASAPNPGAEPFLLLAQAYYQLGKFRDATGPAERAITTARQQGQSIPESWYALQRALYYELQDYPKLLEVLEKLVSAFPRQEYWTHLAATYGELEDEKRQFATYDIAYRLGYLESEQELLLYSQLLLRAEIPYRAGVVLEKGFAAGVVEGSAENYRLLSQAWMLAHENTKAIQALTKAAALSTDGELDARLAQSHASLDQWEQAIESARSALHKGVHDEGDMQILIGNAYFELQRFDEAKAAFQAARQSPGIRETAARWISYIEDEEARLRSLQVTPQ